MTQVNDSGVLLADSVTDLKAATARGRLVACGSHGGEFSGRFADYMGVAGIVFNDAGIGLDAAGVAGVELLARHGRPAAAVGHDTARIGSANDTFAASVRYVNTVAAGLGCRQGDSVAHVLELMRTSEAPKAAGCARPHEHRTMVADDVVRVWAVDSASLVRESDIGTIVVTGSHGGLVGGRVDRALRVDALGAVFNDAGGGRECAGWSRLPALDRRSIPAATVSAASAHIGSGLSTHRDGVISHVNETAAQFGVEPGMTTLDFIDLVAKIRPKGH
jgi:uncharacterized protein YunC (DUF1805 family)